MAPRPLLIAALVWQTAFPLATLTVGSDRLPAGCSLPQSPAIRVDGNQQFRTGLWAGLPITSNPWLGDAASIVAAIQQRVTEPVRMPDGPPLAPSESARFRLRLAEGVEQAYAAVYGDAGQVTVYAVRYAAGAQPAPLPESRHRKSGGLYLTAGQTVVVVTGPDTPCFRAVAAHVKSTAGA